jgi:2-keto-4-pentenoate hydratase/2-oxohepta-3-ene-1,7-dioic acid hydratase in catechol pathway
MRIISFDGGFGTLEGDHVQPLGGTLERFLADPTSATPSGPPLPVDTITLLAPIPVPGKIICVGLNYRDHAAETGKPVPTEPVLFAKFANSVAPDGAHVEVPELARELDWEAELAVVIGRGGRDIPIEAALERVAGYTITNDLSSRTLQRSGGQWTRGKAIDGFLPMGPWMTTADEISDPQQLTVRCLVNGEVMQDGTTAEMVFGVAELVAEISRTITLAPGDVICTGTPPGVGMGKQPPRFLADGDEVTVEIEGLGRLTTYIADRWA